MAQQSLGGPWQAVDGSASGHEHAAVRAVWLDMWQRQYDADPVGALLSLVDEYGVERAVETLATGEGAGDTTADRAAGRARAVRAQIGGLLGDPAVLRLVADRVEQAGRVLAR